MPKKFKKLETVTNLLPVVDAGDAYTSKKKEIRTWRTPRRVNMEQNMQCRRQGVNKESATVITCNDFMLRLFQLVLQVVVFVP